MRPAYAEDLAFVHDDGFGHIATGAAETLITLLKRSNLATGQIVELASGSGISSEILAQAGYDILGYDLSPEMVELAKQRVPQATFKTASLYDAEIPPDVIAVTGIGEAFNYLFDPRAGYDEMTTVFERAYVSLQPGGVLLFDAAQPGRALPRMEHNIFEGPTWKVISEVIEDPIQQRLIRKITTTRLVAGRPRTSEELHELALYNPERVFEILKKIGFRPQILASYSADYIFSPGHGGFAAVKPKPDLFS